MQKVKSLIPHHASTSIVMAVLGHVTFDDQAVSKDSYEKDKVEEACEVYDHLVPYEDELAPQTQDADNDLNQGSKNDLGTGESTSDDLSKSEGDKEENEDGSQNEAAGASIEDFIAMLEGKTLEELREIAKDSEFPEGEWKSFRSPKNLKDYLVSKLIGTSQQ